PLNVSAAPGDPYGVRVAGQRLPLIAPDEILVDFQAAEPGQAFPRVPYSAVIRGDPLYADVGPRGEGRWLPPNEFFRGKIVFLDTLAGPRYETPIGAKPGNELLANATATVLRARPLSQP